MRRHATRTVPAALLTAFFLALLASCSSYPALRPIGGNLPDGVMPDDRGRYLVLRTAETPADAAGLLFYPGGLVEPEAYLSMLAPIAAAGFPVVIVRMPGDLAVFGWRRAAAVCDEAGGLVPGDAGARRWLIGGHSLGGAMAARFAARRGNGCPALAGVVLLASYPASSDSLAGSGYPVLSIWASEDGLATVDDRRRTAHLLPSDAKTVVIDGGNHAGFGEYGPQEGDGQRRIPLEDQHRLVQEAVIEFLGSL